MNVLPPDLTAALEQWGGWKVKGAAPISGGMIHRAARVETPDGPVFVKWNDSPPAEMLHQEAHGLEDIAATQTLRVPRVLGFHNPWTIEYRAHEIRIRPPQYLVLEYVEQTPPAKPDRFDEEFGRRLAAMHNGSSAPRGFGYVTHNFIGRLWQYNDWTADWPDFYRDRRLVPQIEVARGLDRMPAYRERLLLDVCDRLPTLLEGLDSRPSLLHGDLWSGNYLAAGEEPVVIDPAVYYGEREMEIAYMELFGGFSARLFAAYDEAFPLQPGYEDRRPLHQLYPLLVHLNHFGETYGPDVENVCRHYLN